MGESLKSVGAITLFVADPQVSKEFYARVFEADAMFEDDASVALRFENLVLNLLKRGEAVAELLGPVPAGPAGASFELTVSVTDTDGVCDELRGRGVELVLEPVDRPWGVRTAAFLDPDGYAWEIAGPVG